MSWGLENVTVRRGRTTALAGVTIAASRSQVTVVVGGDGAGKSTGLEMLAGLLEPDAGTVRRPPKERIGYVPATAGLYQDLTVAENLDFCAAAYRLTRSAGRRRAEEILQRTGLAGARDRLGGQLSGGMQRKLAVGLALLHSPELLVLDEPTTGVDPVSRAEMWRLITGTAAQGTSVVVTTTYVNEAARADAVVLLESGQVLVSGSPAEILGRVPGTLGAIPAGPGTAGQPGIRSWRRGAGWRVWAPSGSLPDGVPPVQPDFDDAVVIAALAGQADPQHEDLGPGHHPNSVTERTAGPHGGPDGSPPRVRTAGPHSGPDGSPPAAPLAILAEARSASRRFRAVTAVGDVSLEVRRGEVVGLLGGNGAGKTTLIRLLLGLLRPSSGVIRLLGSSPSTETRRRVGYVPQTLGLYAGLTVAENWEFSAAAFGSRSARMPERIAGWRRQLVGGLPLGSQRQVAFAVALSHQPELLVLDEPSSGVGPLGRARLWEQIRQAAERGAGVLVTTHGMDEAQQCDRLVVMADGRIVTAGSTADIIGDRTVTEVRCDDPGRAFAVLDAAGLPVQAYGSVLRVGAAPSVITRLLDSAGIEPSTTTVPAGLEEAFVSLIAPPGSAPRRSEASRAS